MVLVRLLRGMLLSIPVEFLRSVIAEEGIFIEERDRPAHDHEYSVSSSALVSSWIMPIAS